MDRRIKMIELKSSWPELVGVLATLAATEITKERPDVAVEVLPPGAPLTPDVNEKRVRLFIDNSGIVAKTPVIG
uniref:Subtilisin inhibitor 1 n=1 Tax=Leersia perrieri TaxID=77586 RepID=A0A0D9X8B1_9ORYZ